MDDGALGDGDVDEGLDGVVLGGRLRGGGGCRREGGGGLWWAGGPGLGEGPGGGSVGWFCVVVYAVLCVLAWAPAWVSGLGLGLGSGFGLGSGLGLGSGSRLRSTSVRRCEGVDVGSGVVPVRCRGA